jgi:heme-degrading monooxygenase HmoA
MIVRVWRGEATPENVSAYRRHATETVFPGLTALPGHRGACLLTRPRGDRVEILAVTLWDSLEAVKRFAGPDPDVAVVEPAARAVLAAFDEFVLTYEVAYAPDYDPRPM